MSILLFLGLAVGPGLALAAFVYARDKFEKEPLGILIISFLLGMLSCLPAVLLETWGGNMMLRLEATTGLRNYENVALTIIHAFIIVAFSEELSKYFMVRIYAYRKKAFNEPYDGIVYAVMVSLGFATLENILYVAQGGLGIGLLRMFTAVPAHASFGIMMGYYIGLAKFNPQKRTRLLLTGIAVATLMHGFYDYFLMQNNIGAFALMSFIGLAVSIRYSLKAMRKHQDASPFHPDNILLMEETEEDTDKPE